MIPIDTFIFKFLFILSFIFILKFVIQIAIKIMLNDLSLIRVDEKEKVLLMIALSYFLTYILI